VLVLTIAVSACDDPVPEPAEVESCRDLIRVGVQLVEDYVDALVDAPLAVVTGDVELPDDLVALAERGRQLDLSAARLECDAAEMNAEIVKRTAGLETDDPTVQVYLDTVRGGVVGTLPPPETTSTIDESS
jgi:hypothetical protein